MRPLNQRIWKITFKTTNERHTQELWDTGEKNNIGIRDVSGEDSHASNTDQIFDKTIEEKFPKLRKDMPIEMQEANTTPSRQGQKINFIWNIIQSKQ